MHSLFSAGSRLNSIHPAGLILMALALILFALAGRIAEKTGFPKSTLKIIALIICAGGALLAILG